MVNKSIDDGVAELVPGVLFIDEVLDFTDMKVWNEILRDWLTIDPILA